MKISKVIFGALLCVFLCSNSLFSQVNCYEECAENPVVMQTQQAADDAEATYNANPTDYNFYAWQYADLTAFFYELSCVKRCQGEGMAENECEGYFDRLYDIYVKPFAGTRYCDSMNALLMFFLNQWFDCGLLWVK